MLNVNLVLLVLSLEALTLTMDIENGYNEILFRESPLPYSIENRSSALNHRGFIKEAVSELLTRGCIREVSVYPRFCNPLHIAV